MAVAVGALGAAGVGLVGVGAAAASSGHGAPGGAWAAHSLGKGRGQQVPSGPPPQCTLDVGGSGLSAAVVAQANQTIASQVIHASGCDIGIYVGQGVTNVTIDSVKVSGANFQGILAQDTSGLTVEGSTVSNNGFHTIDPNGPLLPSNLHSDVAQAFGISLFGVSHSTVEGNRVFDNGRGGIGIMDNGPNDPGTKTQSTSAPLVASSDDTVIDNEMTRNYNGCAIVLAAQNAGAGLSDLVVAGNTVTGTGSGPTGPDVGGIVVAADPPGSSVSSVLVTGNRVTDSYEGGVIVNAEAPGSTTTNVSVTGNFLEGNNTGDQEAPNTAGVVVFASPAPGASNSGTLVAGNTIVNQFYGIWSSGSSAPTTYGNRILVTSGGTPIFP